MLGFDFDSIVLFLFSMINIEIRRVYTSSNLKWVRYSASMQGCQL